jgi:hypothetical protein
MQRIIRFIGQSYCISKWQEFCLKHVRYLYAMNFRTLIFALAAVVAVDTTAQVTVKRYSVDGSTSSNSANTTRNRNRMISRYPTAVKFNVTPFFSGHYPISVEQRLSPYFTVEAGLGLTLHNTIDAFVDEAIMWSSNSFYTADSRVRPGSSQTLNLKVFPGGDSYDDGFYLGAFIQNRRYNKVFDGVNGPIASFKQNFDQGIMMGYHIRSSDRFLVDLSFGVSNRFVNYPIVGTTYTIDPNTGQELYLAYIDETQDSRYQNIGIFMGLKVGYLMGSGR